MKYRSALLPIVFLLFFATGMTGLVYQVVWQRYLLNVFGATIYSISTVLSAFMGGLALGSWLFGRCSERVKRSLLVYGVLELFVGVAALCVPWMLKLLDPVFGATYHAFGSNFYAFSALRFVLVFAVLLIPTTMMGGTLPLLSKFVSPRGAGAGLRVGLLYALNTTGAVAGTFLSGFYFLRWWGVSRTVLLAAAVNIIAGILAILFSRAFPATGQEASAADSASPEATPEQSRQVRWVLWAYAISGFAALGLEVTWSRALVFTFDLLKNTTYSFTAMLAVFLVGLAVGSAAMTPFVERERQPFRLFAALQALIGLTSIFSFFVLYYRAYTLGDQWFAEFDASSENIRWNASLALVFMRSAATVLLPTFCMGLAFPVAVRAVTLCSKRVGKDVGHLYALNTVGAIVGSAATGFLLLPLLGIAMTIYLLGAVQLLSGIVLLVKSDQTSKVQRYVWAGLGAASLIIAFAYLPRPAIFQRLEPFEKMVYYKEGPLATASVIENSLGYRTIYVDNVGVAGTEPMLLTDQKSLAHLPMLLLPNPKSALTVGFGSGGASYSYTLYPELDQVDCVEITDTVIQAAPTLTDSNRDVIMQRDEYIRRTGAAPKGPALWNDGGKSGWFKADKRYRIVLDDARSLLRFTDHKYDVIATDCTDLRYKSNANLYDKEYFELTRQRITDDGMVVVWMPLGGLSDDAFRVALRTFYQVFPDMEVFYMNNEPTHYVLLIGTKSPLRIDVARLKERLARPQVAKDLGEINLASPAKILSCFICGREKLKAYLKPGVLNTEDYPYIEFESPRYGYGDTPLLDNLDRLIEYRESPERLIASGADAQFLASLRKYYEAVPDIIAGHREYRRLKIQQAAQHYASALARTPDDVSLKSLLDLHELRRKIKGQPQNLWARLELGQALALQKRDTEAVTQLGELLTYCDSSKDPEAANQFRRPALIELARIYEQRGKADRAKQYRDQAAQLPVPAAKP